MTDPAPTHRDAALALVEALQRRFVDRLEGAARALGSTRPLARVDWLRDAGRHGGGNRRELADSPVYGRASVNVSQVHYDDTPAHRLDSATALSAIVHPAAPSAPSMHLHVSWTALRDGVATWRIMADLNPAIPVPAHTAAFADALREAAPAHFERARAQGDRYFFIPALERHRGAAHFYLEGLDSGAWADDAALARRVAEAAIDTYAGLVREAVSQAPSASEHARRAQLAYHTLYAFQVLTLDRGTTAGLLVHDQNDAGVLGSLPPRIDRALLEGWGERLPAPQDALVRAILDALPDGEAPVIDVAAKGRLADALRRHYRAHPEAMALQAPLGSPTS